MNTEEATYCPEDDKLRLYVGRVPREDYERLRAEGWTSTPKQDCDFVAVWTPTRRDTALEFAGIILDEDQSPEDRAADRAERFSGYRDKRTAEATGHADTYEGRQAFGYQNAGRAERAAARHDRHAARACDAWGKAEYWQRRTAGVISHALHRSTPAVRMGRIKELEADARRIEKSHAEYVAKYNAWTACAAIEDADKQARTAYALACYDHGTYTHPTTGKKSSLYRFAEFETEGNPDLLTGAEVARLWLASHGKPGDVEAGEWMQHIRLRLAYENQMLEAQGGRAAFVEMEAGGFVGSFQIRKVNKSNATGRVVSVEVENTLPNRTRRFETIKVERMAANIYRPPTDAERAEFAAKIKAEKAAAPKAAPCPLVNPSDEEAERLQTLWNDEARARRAKSDTRFYSDFVPSAVVRMTQAQYSDLSKGTYARCGTLGVCKNGELEPAFSNMWSSAASERAKARGPALCKIRRTSPADHGHDSPDRIIILTDKPRTPFPASVWPAPVAVDPAPKAATVASIAAAVVVGAQMALF